MYFSKQKLILFNTDNPQLPLYGENVIVRGINNVKKYNKFPQTI